MLTEHALQEGVTQVHCGIELLWVHSQPSSVRVRATNKGVCYIQAHKNSGKRVCVCVFVCVGWPIRLGLCRPVFVAVGSDVGGSLLQEWVARHIGLDQLNYWTERQKKTIWVTHGLSQKVWCECVWEWLTDWLTEWEKENERDRESEK